MNKKAYFKYTAIIASFALVGFLAGFFISAASTKKNNLPQKTVHENNNTLIKTTETEPEPETILPCYLLKNEDETLTLYEIYGDEKNVVKAVSINSQFFPSEDIKKLSDGIELSSLEEGFNIIADFSS